MAEASNSLKLDLSKDYLFGWERRKSDRVVDYLLRSLEAGDILPPVPVTPNLGGYYMAPSIPDPVTRDRPDGGHHRAIAHLIAGTPLEVVIVNAPWPRSYVPVRINDVHIVADSGQLLTKREIDPNYLKHPYEGPN